MGFGRLDRLGKSTESRLGWPDWGPESRLGLPRGALFELECRDSGLEKRAEEDKDPGPKTLGAVVGKTVESSAPRSQD